MASSLDRFPNPASSPPVVKVVTPRLKGQAYEFIGCDGLTGLIEENMLAPRMSSLPPVARALRADAPAGNRRLCDFPFAYIAGSAPKLGAARLMQW